jgi:hypothetical protein
VRIPLSLDQPLGLLIDAIPKNGTKRRIISTLVESFILEHNSTFKESIRSATSTETQSFLNDMRDLLCWKKTNSDPEALAISSSNNTLNEILDSEELAKALRDLSAPLRAGESREVGFDSKLRGAVRRASRIEIIDSYAATNLMSGTPGTIWFLKKISENFDGVISIISAEPKGEVNAPSGVNAKRELVERQLVRLLEETHGFKGEIRLTLISARDFPHNRRLSLRFDSGQATVILEKGLGTFDKDPFSESHELKNADFFEFKKVLTETAKNRDKYELVVKHSDTCSLSDCAA